MFRQQQSEASGFLSILFAQKDEPLSYWDKQVRSGRIKRIIDDNDKTKFQALEILGNNVQSTFISTPTSQHSSLGISLPVLVLIVKNLKRYFFYQVQIRDDKNLRRRFRMTNIPGFNRRLPTVCTFPITFEEGWNELAANLAELTQRVYGTQYMETIRLEIHANCRLREVFFCEKMDSMKGRIALPIDSTLPAHLNNYCSSSLLESCSLDYDANSILDEEDKKSNKMAEALKSITEYEELANNVRSSTNSTSGSIFGQSSTNSVINTNSNNNNLNLTSTRSKNIEDKDKESTNNNTVNNNNSRSRKTKGGKSSNSSSLSFGERLKRDMYYERPKTREKSYDRTRNSRKTSK